VTGKVCKIVKGSTRAEEGHQCINRNQCTHTHTHTHTHTSHAQLTCSAVFLETKSRLPTCHRYALSHYYNHEYDGSGYDESFCRLQTFDSLTTLSLNVDEQTSPAGELCVGYTVRSPSHDSVARFPDTWA
jgi:hypothetical protein